jgi:hypothetical protein
VTAGVDLDGAVATQGADEFLDCLAGPALDPVGDGQGGEHDGEVGVDGFAFVVIDRPGSQVVFGHPVCVLDAPQLVVGADHPGRVGVEVGDVGLPTGQGSGFGLEVAVDAAGAAVDGDEPVPFQWGLPGNRLLRLGDLLVDGVQGSPGSIGLVLVVGRAAPLTAAAAASRSDTTAPAPRPRPAPGGRLVCWSAR